MTSRFCETQDFCVMSNKDTSFYCSRYLYQNICKCTSARVYTVLHVSDPNLFVRNHKNFL